MHYEINVALNGIHFFATHERSINTKQSLARVLPVFMAKFPESEGFDISVTRWETSGSICSIAELLTEG